MLRYTIVTFLFLVALVGAMFTITPSYAQGVQDGNGGTMNQTDGTTTQTGGTTRDDQGGFDWRWLLPLLAIPVVLYFMRDNREEDRSEYRSRGYAGAKGGEARRDRRDDAEEVL